MNRPDSILKVSLSALFLALGWLLPLIAMQIPTIGNMLLPMHIPVMLAGLFLGWKYGCTLGFIVPLTRSLIFGAPNFYPQALSMSFELATYGLVCGLFFRLIFIKHKSTFLPAILISILVAMVCGRLVWGIARFVFALTLGADFTFQLFLSGAFITAWPGIVLQFILIPLIIVALMKTSVGKRLLS